MRDTLDALDALDLPAPPELERLAAIADHLAGDGDPPTLDEIAHAADADTAADLFTARIDHLTRLDVTRREAADLNRRLSRLAHRALTQAGDDLVDAIRPRFARAAARAADLIAAIGMEPDADTAIRAGLTDAYQAHGPALQELEHLRSLVDVLSDRLVYDDRSYTHRPLKGYYAADLLPAAYLDADLDAAAYHEAAAAYQAHGLPGLIAAGFKIGLRTATDARQLLDRIAAEEATPSEPDPDPEQTARNRRHAEAWERTVGAAP